MDSLDSEDVSIETAEIENSTNLNNSGKENEDKLNKSIEDSTNGIELKIENKRNSIGLKTLDELNGKDKFIIDLESGIIKPRIVSGPELLFQKYLSTQSKHKKHKDSVCMNFLSVENGKLENQQVEVKLDKTIELDHSRPGLSHEKMKENLRNQIVQQRLEKLKQRFYKSEKAELEPEDKNYFPNNKEHESCENDSETELNEDEQVLDDESSDSESETVITQKKKKSKGASKFLDDEAIDSDEEESSDSESESEESEQEENDTVQKKGRILKAFEDSDDEDNKKSVNNLEGINSENIERDQSDQNKLTPDLKESEDLFSSQATDFTFNEPSVSEEINVNNLNGLFDAQSQAINDDNLMDLCSGQFASTPSQIILTNNDFNFSQNVLTNTTKESDFISQVPESKESCGAIDDSFVMDVPENIIMEGPQISESDLKVSKDLESNNEEENEKAQPAMKLNKFLESSSDDENVDNNENEKRKIKRKRKKKEKVKKLGFSDDEQEESETEMLEQESSISSDEEIADNPEVFVDYDSEENEIEVKLTKKDREKVAKNYFENEAELSGDEFDKSADEDETGLDKYDMTDLADESEFDQNKLKEEVARIHARKVMDEDIKNIKKIQDLLFENEENDGVGRERKFRWKNQAEGFTVNDENALDVDDLASAEQDEENEIMWRRMRHERETLISEQSQKMGDSDTMSTDILLLDQNSQTVTTASTSSLVKRKFQIIKSSSMGFGININSDASNKMDSPFLIKAANSKKFTHSSFLLRDEQTLSKIASFMSSKDDEVTNLSSHGGNSMMSFAPIEKKEDCGMKRKSEGNNQEKSSIGKKRKVDNQKFLLDQLI